MKIEIPIIVKDPDVTRFEDAKPTEPVEIDEQFFLDGPVSERVAILDFDEKTGRMLPGTPFERPADPNARGTYASSADLRSRDFVRVSVFGTVFKTIRMYEEPDALGRKVRWAFDAPQLLVVPRAGEWRNAFYQRESRSLQFFFFRNPEGKRIYTCQSQDIVAHETTHAILDGIAPDLYDASLPEALAIQEAVADMSAVLAAFRSRDLARHVLAETRGQIQRSSVFNGLAEQYASGTEKLYLRDLLNEATVSKGPNQVDLTEPHALSTVLSGALYKVAVLLYDSLRAEYGQQQRGADKRLVQAAEEKEAVRDARSDFLGAAEKALFVMAQRSKRALLRGLDYLPPGEVSFADLGRAMLAADEAAHPQSDQQREWIRDEFVKRGIAARSRDLDPETNFEVPAVAKLNLDQLVESDWAAYEFANRNWELLRIPKNTPFEVLPRLDVTKRYFHRDGEEEMRECLFKVSWAQVERNGARRGLPERRRYRRGTTLAIDWETKQVRALLTGEGGPQIRERRDEFLTRLADEGLLALDEEALDRAGRPLPGRVRVTTGGGVLRVRASASMLHMAREQ